VPLLLLLAYGAYVSAKSGIALFLALIKASSAVFGVGAGFLATGLGWIPAMAPVTFYYTLLKNIPGTWLRTDFNMNVVGRFATTVGVIVLFMGLAELVLIW
jgi:hypothetical protein